MSTGADYADTTMRVFPGSALTGAGPRSKSASSAVSASLRIIALIGDKAIALFHQRHIVGPSIIEETFTTIVVYPGWKAQVDDAGDCELTRVR